MFSRNRDEKDLTMDQMAEINAIQTIESLSNKETLEYISSIDISKKKNTI